MPTWFSNWSVWNLALWLAMDHSAPISYSFTQIFYASFQPDPQVEFMHSYSEVIDNRLAFHFFWQVPNPLFDLAGITCGHCLVPFWTFFGATLIGKAIIKMHLQVRIGASLSLCLWLDIRSERSGLRQSSQCIFISLPRCLPTLRSINGYWRIVREAWWYSDDILMIFGEGGGG